MAEIVLLVLFTLLLVLSAILVEKEGEAARLSLMEKELSKFSGPEISDPKKLFEELIIARDKAVQRADQLEKRLQEAGKQSAELKAALEKERAAKLAVEQAKGVDPTRKWPPIINLSEAAGYFEVGSAALSEDFKIALVDKVTPKILQIAAEYPDVDVIEVIGHTDEQIVRQRYFNLYTSLIVIPTSGAQLIQVDGTLSQGSGGDVRERRRIEIRLRKYAGPDTVVQGGIPR
jgi:flagellar motor protein MotB